MPFPLISIWLYMFQWLAVWLLPFQSLCFLVSQNSELRGAIYLSLRKKNLKFSKNHKNKKLCGIFPMRQFILIDLIFFCAHFVGKWAPVEENLDEELSGLIALPHVKSSVHSGLLGESSKWRRWLPVGILTETIQFLPLLSRKTTFCAELGTKERAVFCCPGQMTNVAMVCFRKHVCWWFIPEIIHRWMLRGIESLESCWSTDPRTYRIVDRQKLGPWPSRRQSTASADIVFSYVWGYALSVANGKWGLDKSQFQQVNSIWLSWVHLPTLFLSFRYIVNPCYSR